MLLPVSCQETKLKDEIFLFLEYSLIFISKTSSQWNDHTKILMIRNVCIFKEAVKSLFLYVKRVNYE